MSMLIDDAAVCSDDESEEEFVAPENAYDRGFINNSTVPGADVYASTRRSKYRNRQTRHSKLVREHVPDTNRARTKAYDAIILPIGYLVRITPSLNSESLMDAQSGHCDLNIYVLKRDKATGVVRATVPISGIKVEVSALPTKLKYSFVDIMTFNCNTEGTRNPQAVKDMQMTIIGALCRMFKPGVIIKTTHGWMEYEGQKNGQRSIDAMMERFEGRYPINDQESVVFHAGQYEKMH